MVTPTAPERPDRQEGVGEGQKIFSRMLERTELKNLHHAGHEEDEAENEASEENRPGAIQIWFHFCKLELLTASRASQNQIRQRFSGFRISGLQVSQFPIGGMTVDSKLRPEFDPALAPTL
jgi:hypothetical protein